MLPINDGNFRYAVDVEGTVHTHRGLGCLRIGWSPASKGDGMPLQRKPRNMWATKGCWALAAQMLEILASHELTAGLFLSPIIARITALQPNRNIQFEEREGFAPNDFSSLAYLSVPLRSERIVSVEGQLWRGCGRERNSV